MCQKCKQCRKDYENYFDDENCILCTGKSNWNNDKKFKEKYDFFWDNIFNIILKTNESIDESIEYGYENGVLKVYIFKNINFSFFNFKETDNTHYSVYTEDGDYYGENPIFAGLKENINIIFDDCVFEEEIDFTNIEFSNNIIFKDNCIIKKGINFSNNSFSHNIILKVANEIDINCENTSFNKYVDFSKLKINSLILENTTFYENFNLQESKVEELDLTNTLIKNNINLLDFTCTVENRHTARIIKNEFDNSCNYLDANKYFALEMKEYRKELYDIKGKKDEKLIFWLNEHISDFGQNYFKAVLILSFSIFLFYLITLGFEYRHYLIRDSNTYNILKSLYIGINKFAFTTFPFKNLLVKNFEFISFFFSIWYSILIWQIVVAVKRQTRR